MVVEANLEKSRIRYINAYGQQETAAKNERLDLIQLLEQEIVDAQNNSCYICLQLDANGKLGSDVIKGDPNEMSANGNLLMDLVLRQNLIVVNATEKCEGVLTRVREKSHREKSHRKSV